ncbi:MAG: copper resistance protein NlpE [Prevotella sp.]|nr:copper resistance protein NlpE [Prevotella sp.]
MKNKILFSIMAFVLGFCFTACSDDDIAVNTTPLLKDGSVVTGSADVTSTSATMHGTVAGLESQAQSAYVTGFYYGVSQDNLSERVLANSASEFSATIAGMPGTVYYYQAFVTLQGKVTYKGEVSSLILTDSKAITGDYKDLTATTVKLSGQIQQLPADAEVGIVVSGVAGDERVRAGVRIPGVLGSDYSIDALGLIPGTTYYYAAYLDLGQGVVYGDTKEFTTPAKEFDVDNDLVDLGLSTKWAKCNIGANSDTELGALVGFGDLTGYNTSINPEDYASGDVYKSAQDIANKVTDGKTTIPTIAEYEELFRCCKVEWIEKEGVAGYKFTGPNGNSIFMPAAGSRTQGTTTSVGTEGRYLSGSVNATDPQFAMSYLFNQGGNARSTTPVYQALAVRPVSVAKNIPFDKSLLCKTWEIDLTLDGEYKVFHGPTYFYGTQDSWRTVTNGEPVVGDSWCWDPDFAGNSWAVGGSAANCQGSITFNEDGTIVVKHVDAEGKETTEEGTYTVDEANKTITLEGANCLAPANYGPGYTDDLKNNIKILSLTDKTLQLAVMRTDPSQGACLLSINMIPQLEKYGYKAVLSCYGQIPGGGEPSDAWAGATVTVAGGQTGTYTVTFNTSEPRAYGQVYVLDIEGFAAAYPNAFVKIDTLKADGKVIPFDANKFYYGNIQDDGKYRVEIANIWGCGHNDDWTGLKDTPFHPGGGETTEETALAFNSTFEVTFTIVSLDTNLEFTAKQTAVGLNSDWTMPGQWGKENPGAVKVVKENFQYKLASTSDFSMLLDVDADCGGVGPANGAVCLVDIVDIRKYFSGFSAELKSVVNDDVNVPFDASKILYGDIENNGNFRVELHNIWGSGTAANPAFDGSTQVEGNNCVLSLGYQKSCKYTIGNFSSELFAKPW